jgi:hypothetical protein
MFQKGNNGPNMRNIFTERSFYSNEVHDLCSVYFPFYGSNVAQLLLSPETLWLKAKIGDYNSFEKGVFFFFVALGDK